MVTEPIDSWSVLWDTNYRNSILMQDSVRDAFAVALKDLGYSLNSTNIKELTEAKDLLVTQKPLVQAYVVDQVRDKMIGNEAAIGVIYSGEAIYTKRENPDLEYVVPKERLQRLDRFLVHSKRCAACRERREIPEFPLPGRTSH